MLDFPRRGRETARRSVIRSSKRRTSSRSVKLLVRGDDEALRERLRPAGDDVPGRMERPPLLAVSVFADIRSVISTARKYRLNILETLTLSPPEIIARL